MDIQYFDEFHRKYDAEKRTYSFPKYKIKKVQFARTDSNRLSFTLEGEDEKGVLKNIFFEFSARFVDIKNIK